MESCPLIVFGDTNPELCSQSQNKIQPQNVLAFGGLQHAPDQHDKMKSLVILLSHITGTQSYPTIEVANEYICNPAPSLDFPVIAWWIVCQLIIV